MENGKNFPPDTIPRIEEEKRETGPPPEAPVPTPLTEPQRRFAAQYHALIYGFLLEKKLEIREYYDIAAIGYLHAVQRYFTEKSLHRYRFSTIAWRSMNSSLHTFHRQERRRESCEQSYPDLACPVCGGDVNSWDKRCSRALGYRQIVCEGCISEEYQITVENLRYVMENHFGLVPCPGI